MSANDKRAQALRAARACILTDRTHMADTGTDPSGTFDPDTAAALAEYDAVIQQIDAALAAPAAPVAAPKWQPIALSDRYPDEHERVLIFDAKWGEWHVGWNAYAHTIGGPARPGSWVLPFGDTDDMHITHWMPLPAGLGKEGGQG